MVEDDDESYDAADHGPVTVDLDEAHKLWQAEERRAVTTGFHNG